jgi:lipopolysaccharide biosynthesis glycosyltransferase
MILIVSDKDYLKKVKILINSIRKYHNIKIHLHLINYKEDLNIENIEYSYSDLKLDDQTKLKWNNIEYTPKKAYCANIRVKVINDLIKFNPWILYIDADSIVRNNLDNLFSIIKTNDLCANYCDKKSFYRNGFRIRTGILGIKNNSLMINFFNIYSKKIKLFDWFSDQDTLQDVYLEFKNNIKFYKLGMEYIDWKFNNQSIIWTGKGESKYQNENYLNEEKKFL